MCGIVGIISKVQGGLYYSDMDLFEEMLVCDSIRGTDSTGVFGIYKNKQARTLKVAAEPHSLFRCAEWGEFRGKATASMTAVIGHNRSATRGAVTSNNAHPFHEGKIVLVHNGTLHNQKDFNKEVEVDSHAITHALNERPAKEVLKEINGAFAFVWYDREQGKLFIARNSERPLSFIETSTNIMFASEGNMLNWLANRRSVKYPAAEMFPVGQLISFDGKGNKTTEEFELYSPKPVGNMTHLTNGYQKHQNSLGFITMTKTTDIRSVNARIPQGTKVLVKIDEVEQKIMQNNAIKVRGTMLYPQTKIDINGYLDRDLDINDAYKMIRTQYVEGTVQSYHSSNCGPSYFLTNISFPEMIKIHNTTLPMAMWHHVADNHKCDKCGGKLSRHMPEFTSIKLRHTTNKLRAICADCVSEAFSEATEPKKTIIQDSIDNVSTRQPLSQIPEDWPFPGSEQECSLH